MNAQRVTLLSLCLAATLLLVAQETPPAAPAATDSSAAPAATEPTPTPAPPAASETPPPAPPASETPPAPPPAGESPTPPPPAPTGNDTTTTPAGENPTPAPAPAGSTAVDISAPAPLEPVQGTVTETGPALVPSATGPGSVENVTTNTPALDINFPTGGNATIQFPTQQTVPTTASQPDETITVDFPSEEIRTILRSVADLYELNLVIPETLTGTTSVKLRNVTWRQVFQVVLEPVGFTYIMDGNIIKIKSRQELQTEPVETRVFLINSARASELQNSLSPLIDAAAGGRIQVDNRTNALVITERPSRMNNIQEIIERLDRPTQQVSIESKFIELNADNDRTLGIQWNFDGTRLVSSGYAWQYDISHGLNVIQNSGAFPLAQTINNAAATPLSAPGSANLNFAQPTTGLNALNAGATRRAADLAFFNQAQYDAVLRAMQNITDARLVSNPTVVTLDNEEIFIHVGQSLYIVFPSINNQTGEQTPGENIEKEVGIKMRVKPQVSNNGFINLTINPELSRVAAQTDSYFGATYPRFDIRQLKDAKVTLKDGYTLAIGGLINDEDTKRVDQVPLLGDIPVIGYLFRVTRTIKQRRNLIIFITAKTLNPDGATYRDVISPMMMIRTGVTANEVPGYYDRTHVDVPGMTFAPPEERQSMDATQAARDQAALAENLARLRAEQNNPKRNSEGFYKK